MFSVYTVCFFGHRQIDDFRLVEQKVEALIDKLLNEHEYVEFFVGRDGEFDQLVTSAILRCRKRLDTANCSVTWVMPYLKGKQLFKSETEQWLTVQIYAFSTLHIRVAVPIKRFNM